MLTLIAALVLGCAHVPNGTCAYCARVAVRAPTYGYAATNYGHATTFHYGPPAVAVADPYYTALVGGYLRQEADQQAAQVNAEKVARLTASLDALTAKIAAVAQPPPPAQLPPAQPDPAIAPLPPLQTSPVPAGVATAPAPVPPQAQAGAVPLSSLDIAVTTMLRSDCRKCHTAPANGGGGYSLFNADGSDVQLTGGDVYSIAERIADGSMPRGGRRYDATQKALVAQWRTEHGDDISDFIKAFRSQARR